MNFEDWTVDLKTLSATHATGFRLEVEGNPKDPSAVHPGKFPAGLSSIDQVRLVRTGVEAITAAAKKGGHAASGAKPAAKKRPYVAPANKPKRTTLSLKKSSSDPDNG